MSVDQNTVPERPIPEATAARETGWSRRQFHRAIELGEVRTIQFAGRRWVTQSEIARLKDMVQRPPEIAAEPDSKSP
ncbi:MAG: DUF6397 family protein [Mesorhizobium sp.]